MSRLALAVLLVLAAAGAWIALRQQNPLLSLLLGVLVGGIIVVLQARSNNR